MGDWWPAQGELAPLWADDVLAAAIDAAHDNGARVTAHVFGEDALPGLIKAGIDCIEHGTGLTDDIIELMLEHGTALVPTLINVENFPGIADAAGKYPTYAAHMRDLYANCYPRLSAAHEAGVSIYAGTDAGGMIAHGRIGDEVEALTRIGMTPTEALGAACGMPVSGSNVQAWTTEFRQICCATTTIPVTAPRCCNARTWYAARPALLRPNLASRSALDGIRVETIGRYPIDVGGRAVAVEKYGWVTVMRLEKTSSGRT